MASLDSRAPVSSRLDRATALLAHRGPDDTGHFAEGAVAIGFRRLSIFDLSAAGHQPMTSHDGRYVIAFNGAIYNFRELRTELEALGHRFRSCADTEVLLAAFIQWGRDCLLRFNGMWAFVIYDRVQKRLFGARDRFGVKPLYWRADRTALVFASEIKAIRAATGAPIGANPAVLAAFLVEGVLDSDERTFYAGVRQVPPGTCFEADLDGRITWHRYWSVDEAVRGCAMPNDPPAAFAALFEDAVALRMRSDVPVGVLLSGGLDSSSILCSMARQRKADGLEALCYMDPEYDETSYIAATLARTGASMQRLDIAPGGIWDTVGKLVWHQDEPVHSINAVVGFHLLRLARERGLGVVLNGQGADEVLAGYASYFTSYWFELLRAGRLGDLHRSVRAANRSTRGYARLLQAGLGDALRRVPGYLAVSRARRRARLGRESWVTHDLRAHWFPRDYPREVSLETSLRHGLERSHLPVYLRVEDRNAMAHGVEARLPFLDHRLVTLAFRLGTEWKLRGAQTKVLLREAMRGRIPEPVRTRTDKFGFPTSADAWFRGPLYAPMRDLLASRSVREADIWNVARVQAALEQHRAGVINAGEELFNVVQVCRWLQHVNEPVAADPVRELRPVLELQR